MLKVKNMLLFVIAGLFLLNTTGCDVTEKACTKKPCEKKVSLKEGCMKKPCEKKTAIDAFEQNKLLGRGINMGNALDAPREGEWGVTIKEEYFKIMKDAGFDSVRIPVRWSAHSMNEPPYTIDPVFMKRVDWAVNCAIAQKLPVMLNIHHYNEFNLDPEGQKAKYLALWSQIAEHFKDYPDTLMFELLNEPRTKLTPKVWNKMMLESLALVRQSNPNRTIVIGSGDNNIIEHLKDLHIPEDDRNIIVTIHSYDPLELTHQGADWITRYDSSKWLGTKWTGTAAEKKAITDKFDKAAAWGKKHNRPINLGEFGAYNKADMESRACWTKFVADTAIERGMSFHYWEFCAAEFGLYDQQTKSFRKPLLDAVLPAKK
ncbi:MAG: glycoside hydrolase family 5 protein [Phycisphaerae bacterium]|jgi:endoglucanase